jgi:hypothetical protein
LIEARDVVENIVLRFCPPLSSSVGPEHTQPWMEELSALVDKAANPDIQPQEAVPWF